MGKTNHRRRFAANADSEAGTARLRSLRGYPGLRCPFLSPLGAVATAAPGRSRPASARRGPVRNSLSEKDAFLPNEPILKNSQRSITKRLKAGFGRPKPAPNKPKLSGPFLSIGSHFLKYGHVCCVPSSVSTLQRAFGGTRFGVHTLACPPGARSEHPLPGAATYESTPPPVKGGTARARNCVADSRRNLR